jgi:hypothetical protein
MKHVRIRGREGNSVYKEWKNGCLQDRLIEHCSMFQEFTHCLLHNKEKRFQILDVFVMQKGTEALPKYYLLCSFKYEKRVQKSR